MNRERLVRIKTRAEILDKWYLQTEEFVKYLWRIGLMNEDWKIVFKDLWIVDSLPNELLAEIPKEWEVCRVLIKNWKFLDETKGVNAKFKDIVDTPVWIPQAYLVELENGKLYATPSVIFKERKTEYDLIKDYCGFMYVEDLITDHKNLKKQIKVWEKTLDKLQKTENINKLKREIDRIANEMMSVNM